MYFLIDYYIYIDWTANKSVLMFVQQFPSDRIGNRSRYGELNESTLERTVRKPNEQWPGRYNSRMIQTSISLETPFLSIRSTMPSFPDTPSLKSNASRVGLWVEKILSDNITPKLNHKLKNVVVADESTDIRDKQVLVWVHTNNNNTKNRYKCCFLWSIYLITLTHNHVCIFFHNKPPKSSSVSF